MHTENSYKYAPEKFLSIASNNGFSDVRHWIDEDRLLGIYLLEAR